MGWTAVSSRAWAEVVSHDARFEFPDVIGFADGGPDGACWRGGPWAAGGRLHRRAFVAKRDGSLRCLAVLDPAVHARYREIVAAVAVAVERSLSDAVTGARCAAGDGLVLEGWGPAWRRHLRAVRRLPGPQIRLDVRDCFGSIGPDAAADALRRCGATRGEAARVHGMLRRFADDGIVGLPVGPEPSAVLANAALASADRTLQLLGVPFVRWCDDVTASVQRVEASAVVEAWTAALGALGLRPAPEKTRMVEPGRAPRPSTPRPASPRSSASRRGPIAAPGETCERAVDAIEGPDPHAARAAVALVGLIGGRRARSMLRLVRARAPHLAATVDWGLSR